MQRLFSNMKPNSNLIFFQIFLMKSQVSAVGLNIVVIPRCRNTEGSYLELVKHSKAISPNFLILNVRLSTGLY